jgi:hypothetical protein
MMTLNKQDSNLQRADAGTPKTKLVSLETSQTKFDRKSSFATANHSKTIGLTTRKSKRPRSSVPYRRTHPDTIPDVNPQTSFMVSGSEVNLNGGLSTVNRKVFLKYP